MFRAMFYFITEPLGVSISWYWEYLLLVVIVFMAYAISLIVLGISVLLFVGVSRNESGSMRIIEG